MLKAYLANTPRPRRPYTSDGGDTKSHRTAVAYVLRAPQSPSTRHIGRLLLDDKAYPCALGKNGITGFKQEGDGATPRGFIPLVSGFYRMDRVQRPGLVSSHQESFWSRIELGDGWCDAAFTPAYNRPISLPASASHEEMTRQDHLYDRGFVLDWNLLRRAQRRGSAIFLHQARVENGAFKGTLGCIALEANTMAKLAPRLSQLRGIWVL